MKIENQVTSLKLSQKLNELGVKQHSLFYWKAREIKTKFPFLMKLSFDTKKNMQNIYSAFTLSELGEMLKNTSYKSGKYSGKYYAEQYEDNFDLCEGSLTEVEARAKLLINLIKNKTNPRYFLYTS